MPGRLVLVTVLGCFGFLACGGDERPSDFRAAADEVCRTHNERLDEIRDDARGKRLSLEEVVENINREAELTEDQLKELRELDPPPEARAYLARLERNAAGLRKGADALEADGGSSYDAFANQAFNSANAARSEAEELGLQQCSPAPLN